MEKPKIFNTLSKIVSNGLFSAAVALMFAVYNGYLGIVNSYSFGTGIAVYFLSLAATMAVLYPTIGRGGETCDKRDVRLCCTASVLLLVENVLLIAPVAMMVLQQRNFNLGMIAAITVATYATYKITAAIVHYVKTRRSCDVRTTTLRSVKLVDAVVSVLTLQNTLIVANGATENMFVLTAWTSAALYVAIVAVSVRCLVRNLRALRAL